MQADWTQVPRKPIAEAFAPLSTRSAARSLARSITRSIARSIARSITRSVALLMLSLPAVAAAQLTPQSAVQTTPPPTAQPGPAGTPAATAATATTTGLEADPAQVLGGTPTVGAITMMPGETYYGPGPVTVGYLGAKKQLVLPNGAWVLVAVADRASGHATAVPMVSMVFAQFREGRLISLMSFLFSSRAVRGSGWPEADACHNSSAPATGQKEVHVQGPTRACGWTVAQTRMPQVVDPAWEQAPAVVKRLGAVMPPAPLQFTRAWVTDGSGNYLAVRRADFESRAGDAQAAQSLRAAWLRDYLPFMLEGLDKRIGASELEPNQRRAPRIRLTLPD